MASLAGADEGEFADAAASEAEARWTAGEAGNLESICRDVPAVMASPAARRAVLMCEVCRRTQERRSAVREDMHARFPELREDVDAVIEMAWMMMSAEAGVASEEGHARMKEMIPTYDEDIKLPENAERFRDVRRKADEILQLGSR